MSRARSRAKPDCAGLDEAEPRPQPRGYRPRRRLAAARLAILHHAKLFEPHPPHRRSQRHRPGRALHRHHFSLAVPRRADRRAHPEPSGAGPDHRRRDRVFGDGRNRFLDHARSRQAAKPAAGPKLRPERRRALRHRFPDQSGAGGADLAAAGFADQDARAHLRPRRRAAGRQPQSVRPRRRAALRSAAADRGKAGLLRARLHRRADVARPRRSAALSRARPRRRQGLFRSGAAP